MTVDIIPSSPSKARLYTGFVLSTLAILFFLMDAAMKFTTNPQVVEAQRQLEIPASLSPVLGVIALVCIALYAIPATSILGAVLLTAYLGGAVAVHLRVDNPLFSHTLFPVYIALFIWGGLWLRHANLRTLFPFTTRPVIINASKKLLVTGYVLTVLGALFIVFTAIMKFVYTPPAGAPPPAFPLHHMHHLAFMEFACITLYLFPSTSVLGTVLMTGYLGGATAINLRGGESVAASLIPALVSAVLWAGIWLRDTRLQALLPLRTK